MKNIDAVLCFKSDVYLTNKYTEYIERPLSFLK